MYSFRSFLNSLNVEPKKTPPVHSGGPPMHMLSNSASVADQIQQPICATTTAVYTAPIPKFQSTKEWLFLQASSFDPSQMTKPQVNVLHLHKQVEKSFQHSSQNIWCFKKLFLFFSTLRSQLSKWSADEAAEIVRATMSTISRNVAQLDASAGNADGGQLKTRGYF